MDDPAREGGGVTAVGALAGALARSLSQPANGCHLDGQLALSASHRASEATFSGQLDRQIHRSANDRTSVRSVTRSMNQVRVER
jgi:hypothetical protein